ncbi:PQQ-dependent sugar dehydrogenase [Gordonia sp. LSe1-13]|uniref:PQQ-dependent sugar dehydrogenase n=1 Tax=Gordonia sesuvii TaxID=3116777 RepID=A0ABU7MHR4_9ACTN|nr:PQQ-dependent sugar dehydrogenase [Gordonia sp. LSe1-13]
MVGATLGLLVITASGCADFTEQDRAQDAGAWSANNESPARQEQPRPSPTEPPAPPPPGPCVDPDPAVIATCLQSTGSVMPGDDRGEVTVVAERTTGKIITTKRYGPHRVLATAPVDASGDGGLIDFAFSPTYDQDRLIYALITTPADNRIVRLAPNDVPKPILVGIPKGATGNMGSMYFRTPGELIVATGNAGSPAAATDPSSLAGKILAVTSFRSGANPPPRVLASGLGSTVSLCPSATTGTVYVADQTATEDRVQVLEQSGPKVLWTWPDRPQIAGCAVTSGAIFVSTTRTQRIEALSEPTGEQPAITPPAVVLEKRYGALGRMVALENGVLQFATVNRTSGRPVSTDDRVVRWLPPSSSEDRT